jgi:hypothetical protein
MSGLRAPKVLVISPAGMVENRDDVIWYSLLEEKVIDRYFNIGDMIVYDSTLKLMEFNCIKPMNIQSPTESEIEEYKTYDFVVIRASNFVHNEMDFFDAADTLEKIKLPVYAIGVGAQSSGKSLYHLTGKNLRFWKIVSERSRVIGVRGTFSADVFSHNGMKNIEVVGCPSIFRTRNRNLKITKPESIADVAFSLRREYSHTYTENPEEYLRLQRDLMLEADENYKITLTSHGEPEEKSFFYKNQERMRINEKYFVESGWFNENNIEKMRQIYTNKHFFFLRVAQYDRFIRKQDFAIGLRVHGVLPALANGVPGLLLSYDSRSTELADSLCIPSMPLADTEGKSIGEIIDQVSFDEFNRNYTLFYDRMKFAFEANGLAHRM